VKNSKKLSIILFRNYGIKYGQGYQPVYIFKFLKDILYKIYLLRVQGRYKLDKMIKIFPLSFLFRIYLRNVFLPKYFRINLFKKSLYDFFNDFLIKKIDLSSEFYLFNYAPSEDILQKLKNDHKKLLLFYGGMSPLYYYKTKKRELMKIGLTLDSREYLSGIREDKLFKKYFKKVILMSEYSKKNWIKWGYQGDIYVNHLGVDYEYFDRPIDKRQRINDKIFLFVGRIEVMKGLHYLLDAWEQLNLKDAKLWLVGTKKSKEWSYFEKKIKKTRTVEFLGYRTDLPNIYNRALVLILPSFSEGCSRVVLEAKASGVPIIGTPCISELFIKNREGFEVNYCNINQLKKYIKYFYDNPSKAIEMGFSAKSKIKDQTWSSFGNAFKNNILNILNS